MIIQNTVDAMLYELTVTKYKEKPAFSSLPVIAWRVDDSSEPPIPVCASGECEYRNGYFAVFFPGNCAWVCGATTGTGMQSMKDFLVELRDSVPF